MRSQPAIIHEYMSMSSNRFNAWISGALLSNTVMRSALWSC